MQPRLGQLKSKQLLYPSRLSRGSHRLLQTQRRQQTKLLLFSMNRDGYNINLLGILNAMAKTTNYANRQLVRKFLGIIGKQKQDDIWLGKGSLITNHMESMSVCTALRLRRCCASTTSSPIGVANFRQIYQGYDVTDKPIIWSVWKYWFNLVFGSINCKLSFISQYIQQEVCYCNYNIIYFRYFAQNEPPSKSLFIYCA